MPWRPLPRIVFAIATYPFGASSPADLPLEIGDELYIIEQGGVDGAWFRGYLVAPPSLLTGLTSGKGQTLEARVFSGIFPRCCVDVREVLGDTETDGQAHSTLANADILGFGNTSSDSLQVTSPLARKKIMRHSKSNGSIARGSLVSNVEILKDAGAANSPFRSASRRRSEYLNSPGLARTLSHHSITNTRSSTSPVLPMPVPGTPRDPEAKRPQAPLPMVKIGDETPTSISEPLVDEIASCLREWHSKNLHELLLARRYSVLEKISDLVSRIDLARRQLLHRVLTARELASLREETVWNLVGGNKLLSNEIVVRDPKQHGRLLTGNDSPFEISELQSTMSLLDRPPIFKQDPINLYHLIVELKSFTNNGLISPSLDIHLCTQTTGEPLMALTESFVIDLPPPEDFEKSASAGLLRTLFTNLTSSDIGDASRPGVDIYLVVNVRASQAIRRESFSSPRKANRHEERGSPGRPATSTFSGKSTMKGGRQSIIWAQKQFGSVRSRQNQEYSSPQAPSNPDSSNSLEAESRPNTRDSSRPPTQQGTCYVKRNIGVSVVNVKHVFAQGVPGDRHLSIWAPATSNFDIEEGSEGWDNIIRDLVGSQTGTYTKARTVDHIRIGLQSFASPDADDLISKTPTLLQNIASTAKVSLSGAPNAPRSDIYLTISEASLPHQALLSHPERGTVQLSLSSGLRNVQLTLEVRRKSGERIENCILPGSNSSGQTAWRTLAVERGEGWNQMVKLSIPVDDVPESHLIMSIADAPGFPFALSWIPLWNEDAFIKDGSHAPLLYLYDKLTSSSDKGRGAYLAFPWDSRGRDGDVKEVTLTGTVATLKLETRLCSTYFSQDKVLLGIIKWREQSTGQVLQLLKQFAFVPEIEIVKRVGDVFDALFGILVSNADKAEYEDSVFGTLTTVLGIVHDRRFNLGPFVDEYAHQRFDYPYATPCMIKSYFRLLASPNDPHKSRSLRATFKVGRQVFKFIFCAREKQRLLETGLGANTQPAFLRDIKGIFDSFQALMRDSSPTSVGSKTLMVQYMHTWLPELRASLSEEEILQIIRDFVASCADVQGKLILHKLVLILNLTNTGIFSQASVCQSIIDSTVEWIEPYWGFGNDGSHQWREQVRLCSSIIAKQSHEPGFDSSNYLLKAIFSYNDLISPRSNAKDTLSLLFPTTYPFPSKPTSQTASFDEALTELAALLAKLAGAPIVVPTPSLKIEHAEIVFIALEVIASILIGNAFPKTWLSLYVYHHKSMLQILDSLFDLMVIHLIPAPEDADKFNTELWRKFLTTLLMLTGSNTLALETFPEQKRRAVWKIAGDVREQGATLLKRAWEAIGWEASPEDLKHYGLPHLGGFQVQYVPNLVQPIVELCLSVHEGLRRVSVRILQSMIISEWTLNEDLSIVQAEIVDCLDLLFKSKNMGDSMVPKMFVSELLDLFESFGRGTGDHLWQAIKDMVSTIDELLKLLAAVHSPDMAMNLQIRKTLDLMSFLKDLRNEDMFIRYIHQLVDVQKRLNNMAEAGLVLRLHADLYDWSSTNVKPLTDPTYPEQSSFDRKEQLYFEMIRYFEEGTAWESALASYRELSNQYENSHYDFAKLARTQRSMATIYETIARGEWQVPRYYVVSYYGLGFPHSQRNKQFVYEGEPQERQPLFADRMRQLHPSAQIVSKGGVDDMEGQYLQISPVSPHRDLGHPIYHQMKVAQSIREYVTCSKRRRFAFTSNRPSSLAFDVQNQWIEKTVYSTRESFPIIQRSSEVIAVDVVRLSPLQTALERTLRKTSELPALERRIATGEDSSWEKMTEAIIASVRNDSATTVAQYRQLLPTEPEENGRYAPEEPTLSPLHNSLQIALLDHVSTLKHCISLYSHPAQLATQASLLERLHTTFAPEIEVLFPNPPPEHSRSLPSAPPSSSGETSATTLALTNGHVPEAQLPQRPEDRPRQVSRLSLNFLKTYSPSLSRTNGTISVPSEDSSSSGRVNSSSGHANQPVHKTPHHSMVANTTMPTRHTQGEETSSERPGTAQSGRSGKVRNRLSLLGIGRASSPKDKPRMEGMGGVAEE